MKILAEPFCVQASLSAREKARHVMYGQWLSKVFKRIT